MSEHQSNPQSEPVAAAAGARRRLPVAYAVALLLSMSTTLVVLLLRTYSVSQNYQWSATGGLEGAGAFGIFKACSGESIYHDFTNSTVGFIFNFLFYDFYGLLLGAIGSCDLTPLLGRGITLLFLAVFAVGLIIWFRRETSLFERLSLALLVISPMMGWWALSLRPDVGGMVFFAAGIVALLAYLERSTVLNLLIVALFVFLAWSFKQPYLFIVPLIGLFLLLRNFRHALLFAAVMAAGLIATLLLQPDSYLTHTVTLPSGHPVLLSVAIRNALQFITKASGPLAGTAILIFLLPRSRLRQPGNQFLLAALAWSMVVLGAAASKVGAADNYYFPPFALLLIFLLHNIGHVRVRRRQAVLVVVSILTIVTNVVVLSGVRGRTSLDMSARTETLAVQKALEQAADPKLVWGELIALPWVSPQAETRILDQYIDFYQTQSIPGVLDITGRVKSGYYATIAMPASETRHLDLSRYEINGQYGANSIWIRKTGPAE